jgi:predicted N-formylglutamate amidohydrolase
MQRELPDDACLLGADDPAPVLIRDGASSYLLTVEHAGRAIPSGLGDLGLPSGQIDRHIGWDIGALKLAEAMQAIMPATVIAQRYSRLVIDTNRPWGAPDLAPAESDGTAVPGNEALATDALRRRWNEIHRPFHDAVAARCDTGAKALIAIHSYDVQRRADRTVRPWPIGLLWRRGNRLAEGLAERLSGEAAALPLGINQPYAIDDDGDYTIPVHGEARELPHVLVEVRNDYLRDAEGITSMARVLARACLEQELA